MGDEGAHAELVGQGQGLTVVVLGRLDLGRIAMRGDLAEQAESPRLVGPVTALAARAIRRAPWRVGASSSRPASE